MHICVIKHFMLAGLHNIVSLHLFFVFILRNTETVFVQVWWAWPHKSKFEGLEAKLGQSLLHNLGDVYRVRRSCSRETFDPAVSARPSARRIRTGLPKQKIYEFSWRNIDDCTSHGTSVYSEHNHATCVFISYSRMCAWFVNEYFSYDFCNKWLAEKNIVGTPPIGLLNDLSIITCFYLAF